MALLSPAANWDLWSANALEQATAERLAYVLVGSRGRALAGHGPEYGPDPALRHRFPEAGRPLSERPLPRSGEGYVRCDWSELPQGQDHELSARGLPQPSPLPRSLRPAPPRRPRIRRDSPSRTWQ